MATTSGLSGLKGIKIRTDYVPKAKKSAKAAVVTQICPRCRRAIPAAEMDQHVRIELLDPKWREQRDRAAENSSGTNLLTDSTISDNLKRISAYRADIFDLDETKAKDKVSKLREMAKEKEDKIWDGHSTTIVSVQQKAFTAGMAELQASIQRRLREEEEKSKIGPQAPLKPGSAPPALSGATFTGSMTVLPPTFIPFSAATAPPPATAPAPLPLPGFRPAQPAPPTMVPPPPPPRLPPPTMSAAPVMFEARPLIHPQRQQQMAPPPPSSGGPMGGYGAPPPPPPSMAAKRTASENVDGEDMPAPKRMKGEPTLPGFIPEEHFMGMAKGPITVQIRVIPNATVSKNGWNVPDNPQTLLRVPGMLPTHRIADLKDLIAAQTQWPASRQKLILEERTGYGFHTGRHVLKDGMTGAYYNLVAGDVLELTMKERGGKK